MYLEYWKLPHSTKNCPRFKCNSVYFFYSGCLPRSGLKSDFDETDVCSPPTSSLSDHLSSSFKSETPKPHQPSSPYHGTLPTTHRVTHKTFKKFNLGSILRACGQDTVDRSSDKTRTTACSHSNLTWHT